MLCWLLEDDLILDSTNMNSLLATSSRRQEETVTPIVYALPPIVPEILEIVQPPPANRGLKTQSTQNDLSLAIDYLTMVVRGRSWEEIQFLRSEIEDWGKTSFVDKPGIGTKHGTYFRNHMKCPLGSKIAYQECVMNAGAFDAIIVIAGQVCSRMGASKVAAFIRESLLIGAHVSRIDIKTDDYQRLINVDFLQLVVEEGRYTTFRGATIIEGHVRNKGRDGFTINFGSRTGEKLMRIYDALPVHGIDANRHEAEFKGEYATAIGKVIASCEDDESLTRLLSGLLNGVFRITREAYTTNVDRVATDPLWEQFSTRLENGTKLVREAITVTLAAKLRWLRERCSKSLAMFRTYYGDEWRTMFNLLCREGQSRFNSEDLAMLSAANRDGTKQLWGDDSFVIDLPINPWWWTGHTEFNTFQMENAPF